MIICLNISKAACGWKAGYGYAVSIKLTGTEMAPTYHFVTSLIYTSGRSVSEETTTVRIQTHAKEKLPTFCIAATGAPLMVIFVNGVFARVWDPNQSIARTEAWPPNQLQLKRKKP